MPRCSELLRIERSYFFSGPAGGRQLAWRVSRPTFGLRWHEAFLISRYAGRGGRSSRPGDSVSVFSPLCAFGGSGGLGGLPAPGFPAGPVCSGVSNGAETVGDSKSCVDDL